MATAITPLANITLGSSQATVVFSSISSSFRDLMFVCNLQASATNDVKIRVNGLTTNIYNSYGMYGNGTTADQYVLSRNATYLGTEAVSATSGQFSTKIVNIMDYSATDKHHQVLVRNDTSGGANGATAVTGRIADTAAITSVTFMFDTGATFAAGSTFSLFGVSA